jgi:hypothetical protein
VRVSIGPNLELADKVERWRFEQLGRLFPGMPADERLDLAQGADRCLLEKAARLAADGCPVELAYEILR